MGFTAGSGRPTPIEPPKPTPTPPPPMSGGKGAGRVSPTVESRPLFSGINDINKMSSQRPGRVLTDPVPPRAGGKGGARVQPTAPAATQEVVEKSEFPPEVKPYVTDIVDKANAQEQAGQQSGTITAPPPTPIRGGGKAGPTADRVAPVTPQPMPMTPPPAPMTPPPIPPGLDNPVFRSLGQQQAVQQPQQSITGMNTNTGSTNSMPAPQSAIFKQGGLIGLMRRR
tara:strand:+ start:3392 stop:4069 length:678 start_codon:yes stop_codon:yes gene_type:complete